MKKVHVGCIGIQKKKGLMERKIKRKFSGSESHFCHVLTFTVFENFSVEVLQVSVFLPINYLPDMIWEEIKEITYRKQ